MLLFLINCSSNEQLYDHDDVWVLVIYIEKILRDLLLTNYL